MGQGRGRPIGSGKCLAQQYVMSCLWVLESMGVGCIQLKTLAQTKADHAQLARAVISLARQDRLIAFNVRFGQQTTKVIGLPDAVIKTHTGEMVALRDVAGVLPWMSGNYRRFGENVDKSDPEAFELLVGALQLRAVVGTEVVKPVNDVGVALQWVDVRERLYAEWRQAAVRGQGHDET